MANRTLTQFTYSNELQPVNLYAQVTFGATGAPTVNYGGGIILSMVRNSAGNYTITLKDKWMRLLGIRHTFNTGGSTAPASPSMFIQTNSVSAATPLVRVVFNIAGTATDPANGEIVYMNFIMKNSSV